DAKLVYVQPHMHLRGKDYEVRVTYPSGEKETVFKAKWNFDWQLGYEFEKPIVVPRGTKIMTVAHYDNSANNPYNPDPTKPVYSADQNWEEMQSGFLGLVLDVNTDLTKVLKPSGPSLLPKAGPGPTLISLTK